LVQKPRREFARSCGQAGSIRSFHDRREMLANLVMPIRPGPAAVGETAFGIFLCTARRLDHTVEGDEFRTISSRMISP
jgi:hypothetical protein